MSVYSDQIKDEARSRARMRVTPDMIFNMPNHHCICSWISQGARAPAFIVQTIPLATDQTVIDHHLNAQRERGGFVPDRLPDPMPDMDWEGVGKLPTAVIGEPESSPIEASAVHETAPVPVAMGIAVAQESSTMVVERVHAVMPSPLTKTRIQTSESPSADPGVEVDPGAFAVDGDGGVDRVVESREQGGAVPESYRELDLDDVKGLIWEQQQPLAEGRNPEVTERDLDILGALWSYRFLFALVGRRFGTRRPARTQAHGRGGLGQAIQVPSTRARRATTGVLPDTERIRVGARTGWTTRRLHSCGRDLARCADRRPAQDPAGSARQRVHAETPGADR